MTTSAATAYPLCWPPAFPRTKTREKGAFRTSLAGALDNVRTSLSCFGKDSGKQVEGVVLSSNVALGVAKPEDPGVAVWFTWDGLQVCIPVDRYATPEANLQAIHHVIEARRTELRHGTLALVRATMTGFKALPAPAGEAQTRPWNVVLGVPPDASRHDIEIMHRRLSKGAHPDAPGGSAARMSEINIARDEGLRECEA